MILNQTSKRTQTASESCEASTTSKDSKLCTSTSSNQFEQEDSIPKTVVGGSKMQVFKRTAADVVRRIKQLKIENSSLLGREIRDRLLQESICTLDKLPSISTINRIVCKLLDSSTTSFNSFIQYNPLLNEYVSQASDTTDSIVKSSNSVSFENLTNDTDVSNFSMEEVEYKIIKADSYQINNDVISIKQEPGSPSLSTKKILRHRTNFTREQLALLEKEFERSHYPDIITRETLSKITNLRKDRIHVWFCNRRARLRRKNLSEYKNDSNIYDGSSTSIQCMKSPIILSISNPKELPDYTIESDASQYDHKIDHHQPQSCLQFYNYPFVSSCPIYDSSIDDSYEDSSSTQMSSFNHSLN